MVAEQWESTFSQTVDLYPLRMSYIKMQSTMKDGDAFTA